MTRTLILLLLLQLYVVMVHGSHFMGATIRWKSDPDVDNKATFYWKAGWRISRGPCSDSACTVDDIGRLGTNIDSGNGKDMYCHVGCSGGDTGILANSNYWITAVSVADNYEMGENEFTHTFEGAGPYKVGLEGYAWRSLDVSTAYDPSWAILTTVVFGDRTDTGRPNNSPMTAAFPIYNLQFDCEGKIKLPLVDPDGDTVKCRWGNTAEECGDVCNALPGVVIDEDTCELTIDPTSSNSYVDDGWYVGAIILEDFPRSTITLGGQTYTETDPMSAVPLAFLVRTPTFGTACTAKPVFVPPTPEPDTVYFLEPFESLGISMYAVNEEDTNAAITQIDVVSPSGVITSSLVDDDQGRTGVKYRTAYWTPTILQSGANTICFMALDSTGKYSEYRCVYVYANDVDECLSNPCQNGGTCNNLENIYTCTCDTGTTGYNCETDSTDDCAGGGSSSCAAGSTCVDGINSFSCTCDAGYDGQFCDNDIDECAISPCQNGGTCSGGAAAYTCACETGYEGSACDTVTDMCNPQPCQNSGTCYNIIGDYVCVCDEGYTGDDCETDTDDCASSPCYNGGTCTDAVAGFSCSCVSGWSGSSCQDYDDPCSGTPCQNGGTCQADCSAGLTSAAGYSCACDVGFIGIHCEVANAPTTTATEEPTTSTSTSTSKSTAAPPTTTTTLPQTTTTTTTTTTATDYCTGSPCLNGGTCTGHASGFTCSCLAGYLGTRCETELPPPTTEAICYNSTCSCSSDLEWSGVGLDFACECTDCNGGVVGNTTNVLEGRTACLRNIYVMFLAGLGGIVLSSIIFASYFLIIDLRRRYNMLLNGSDPDDNDDGYGSSISLTGLRQVPSRMSVGTVSKVGVIEKPKQDESRMPKKSPIVVEDEPRQYDKPREPKKSPRLKPESQFDDEDPEALAHQYLKNDSYGAFMFSGGKKDNNRKGPNTSTANNNNNNNYNNNVRSTSSSSKEKSDMLIIDDGVESLMDESIEEENDILQEKEEKKRKKDKKEKKEKKEKKSKDEKKESKKDKKERRRGWD